MARAFRELGLLVGNQSQAERLVSDWAIRNFRPLIQYCRTAQAFQDAPFSLPFTYVVLDHNFPGSKFILTIRDTPEQWYDSLIKHLSRLFGNGSLPTLENLKAANYVYPGWAYEVNRLIENTPEDDLFHKETLIADYNFHNKMVKDYFRHRPNDLLVMNVKEPDAYTKLSNFLEISAVGNEFPWENKGQEMNPGFRFGNGPTGVECH